MKGPKNGMMFVTVMMKEIGDDKPVDKGVESGKIPAQYSGEVVESGHDKKEQDAGGNDNEAVHRDGRISPIPINVHSNLQFQDNLS